MKYTEAETEIVADDGNLCGEAPTWDPVGERLIWTDLSASLVYEFHPRTGRKCIISRDLMVSGIARNDDGRLVFAGSHGLHLWESQDHHRTILTHFDGVPLFFNDIIAGPSGRLYAGTVYWGPGGMERLGALYLIDNRGEARVVDDGLEHANGLAFATDDRTLYFANSTARQIYRYRVDPATGNPFDRRVFAQFSDDDGLPDGLTVDSEGFVWSAMWYGSNIIRLDPDGQVERRIALPVQQVSSLTFGGPDLTTLYITSAADPWRSSYAPARFDPTDNVGGQLYRIAPAGVRGRPEHTASIALAGQRI